MANFVPSIKVMFLDYPNTVMTHRCACFLPRYNTQQLEAGQKDSRYGIIGFIQIYMKIEHAHPQFCRMLGASPLVQNITNQCHFGEWALSVCLYFGLC